MKTAPNLPQKEREVKILTFGCRLNSFESEVMREHAQAQGLTDAIIINSCAVTQEAERQARQAIRRARRENPGAELIVTGCAAQLDPAGYAAMPEVDRVLGNQEKLARESFAATRTDGLPQDRVAVADIMTVADTAGHLISGFAERTRAFIEVQQGCDHRCTFCIIPFARGPSRSVPLGAVVRQVRRLIADGVAEVVLTGVDLSSYGQDLPGRPSLGALARRLLGHVPELPRLRLSSLDPVEIDADLWRLLAEEPRLMPHLHLSLQAGSDLILKRMKRRHSRADAIVVCRRARQLRPDVVLGADLIAGFPTESEAMFEETLALVDDCGLTYLHVFPYSERPDTPAARMPAVPKALRKERAARLRRAGGRALAGYLAGRVGSQASVLVEKPGLGRSEHFAPVEIDPNIAPGQIVVARITAATPVNLVGEVSS